MVIAVATESSSAKFRKDEKGRLFAICGEIGTLLSNAIRMFIFAFSYRGDLPFGPSSPYGFRSKTLVAMDGAGTGRKLSGLTKRWREAIVAFGKEWAMMELGFTSKRKINCKRIKRQGLC